jgi:photosystem II stability/assembly factor-like uncharacterized protein
MTQSNLSLAHLFRTLLIVILSTSATTAIAASERPALQVPLASMAPLVAASRAGNAFVAVGDYGVIVTSDDGKAWQQSTVPVDTPLTAVHFIDARQGWAVGHGGVVLHTTDGGRVWQLLSRMEGAPVLLDVWFENALHGIAVGAYGTAATSRDGGKTWQKAPVGEGRDGDLHLNAIVTDHAGRLFLAAEGGAIFRSADNGMSWSRLNSGVTGSLWGGLALRDGGVMLFGMSGRILVTHTQGAQWHAVSSGTQEALTGGTQLADGRIAIVGNGGVVTVSSDGARTFTASVRSDRQNLAAVAASVSELLLFGQQGVKTSPLSH